MKKLGITDTVTTCDCCGRKGLARTVAFENAHEEIIYYGTTCATHHGISKNTVSSLIDINTIKTRSHSFKVFVAETKRLGYGFRLRSPLTHDVECVQWELRRPEENETIIVKYTDFAA